MQEMKGICCGTRIKRVDQKGRMGIPSERLEMFRRGSVIVERRDSLLLYPVEKLGGNIDYSKMMEIIIDKQGRFSIPKEVRMRVFPSFRQGEPFELVVYGRGDHFEIKLQQ